MNSRGGWGISPASGARAHAAAPLADALPYWRRSGWGQAGRPRPVPPISPRGGAAGTAPEAQVQVFAVAGAGSGFSVSALLLD